MSRGNLAVARFVSFSTCHAPPPRNSLSLGFAMLYRFSPLRLPGAFASVWCHGLWLLAQRLAGHGGQLRASAPDFHT